MLHTNESQHEFKYTQETRVELSAGYIVILYLTGQSTYFPSTTAFHDGCVERIFFKKGDFVNSQMSSSH